VECALIQNAYGQIVIKEIYMRGKIFNNCIFIPLKDQAKNKRPINCG
jgi:hypothetical protein